MANPRRYQYRQENNCPCGSGSTARAIYDARGIFVFFACDTCIEKKCSAFRPEIFTDPNYSHDEPLDSES
jgi:hypothetical protein